MREAPTGKEKGSRSLLKQLTWQYSAGYFYKAAREWLENAPLAPTSSLPTMVIQLQGSSELRASPNTNSMILDKQPAGTRLVATSLTGKNQYVAVQTGLQQEPAFVRSNQVRWAPVKIEQKSVRLTFVAGTKAGIEQLGNESRMQIQTLSNRFTPLLSRVDLIGYQYRGTTRIRRDNLRLLSREAEVIEVLTDIGYDASKIAISEGESSNTEDEDAIWVRFSGSSLPDTEAFQKFNAEAFIKVQNSSNAVLEAMAPWGGKEVGWEPPNRFVPQ